MSGKSEAHTFYYEHVSPLLLDWRNDYTSIYKARQVAINLYHLVEYYWSSFNLTPDKVFDKNNLKSLRNYLAELYPDFGLIRDVCDIHKHCRITRTSRRVTNESQITVGAMGWDKGKWGDMRWDCNEEIIVIDDNLEKHHFFGIVNRVEIMWKKLLEIN